MEPYIGHLISVAIMLAGLVALYVKVMARLTKIEVRLEIDDKGAPERAKVEQLKMREAARSYCREECPRTGTAGTGTNPRIQQFAGEIEA